MSIATFEGSELFAFVGSPLFARNRAKLSVDFIQRMLSGNQQHFTNTPIVFPLPEPNPAIRHFSQGNPLGTPSPTQLSAGWNRVTFLVWGVDNICNPWEAPPEQTFQVPSGVGSVPVTVYDDTEEVYLQIFGPTLQEIIPNNRPFLVTVPESRIPLNAHNPDSGDFVKSVGLVHFVRTIAFSIHVDAPAEWSWYQFLGRTRLRNLAYSVGAGLHQTAENIGTRNASGFEPQNPMLFNGQQLGLFFNANNTDTGLGMVLQSIAPEANHRPRLYTDISAAPVP